MFSLFAYTHSQPAIVIYYYFNSIEFNILYELLIIVPIWI